VSLGTLPGDDPISHGVGISPDGSQIVLQSNTATVWTWSSGGGLADTGVVAVPSSPASDGATLANYASISNTGEVFIVGYITPASVTTGYLHEIVPSDTTTVLPAPDGAVGWQSMQATLDGAYVAGTWDDGDLQHVALWHNGTDITSIDAPGGFLINTVSGFAGRGITATGPAFVGTLGEAE
jgi:hypothetical protein